MSRKGQFKKGGGRIGDGRKYTKRSGYVTGSSAARPRGGALVVVDQYAMTARRPPSKPRPRKTLHMGHGHGGGGGSKKKRASRGGGGGTSWKRLAAAAVVLSNVAGTNSGPLGAKVYDLVQKIPGAKTFGGAATAGLALGALGKYTGIGGRRVRPWLHAAGVVGIILAGAKVGEAGTKFAWVGDDGTSRRRRGSDGIMDVETD